MLHWPQLCFRQAVLCCLGLTMVTGLLQPVMAQPVQPAATEARPSLSAAEIRWRFEKQVYGQAPPLLPIRAQRLRKGHLQQPEAYFEEHQLELMVFPPGKAPQPVRNIQLLLLKKDPAAKGPVILFLNTCGNQSVVADPQVTPTTQTLALCPGAMQQPGWRARFWALEAPLAAGYTLASFHSSDIAPDHPQLYAESLQQLPLRLNRYAEPGLLALWAWGLKHVRQYLALNYPTIGLMGHSRRGKAALWAAASDTRFAFVLAHHTGTLGAVSVQDNPIETLDQILFNFPHWFTPGLKTLRLHPAHLPVQQHDLLGLIAPRPVAVSEGFFDFWASPVDSFATVQRAWPVYGLKSAAPAGSYWLDDPDTTALEQPLAHIMGWHGHGMNAHYWPALLRFLEGKTP